MVFAKVAGSRVARRSRRSRRGARRRRRRRRVGSARAGSRRRVGTRTAACWGRRRGWSRRGPCDSSTSPQGREASSAARRAASCSAPLVGPGARAPRASCSAARCGRPPRRSVVRRPRCRPGRRCPGTSSGPLTSRFSRRSRSIVAPTTAPIDPRSSAPALRVATASSTVPATVRPSAVTACWNCGPSGFEVSASTNTPASLASAVSIIGSSEPMPR